MVSCCTLFIQGLSATSPSETSNRCPNKKRMKHLPLVCNFETNVWHASGWARSIQRKNLMGKGSSNCTRAFEKLQNAFFLLGYHSSQQEDRSLLAGIPMRKATNPPTEIPSVRADTTPHTGHSTHMTIHMISSNTQNHSIICFGHTPEVSKIASKASKEP